MYKFNRDLKKFRDEADFCDRQRREVDRALQFLSMGHQEGLLRHHLSMSNRIEENLSLLGQSMWAANNQKQLEQSQDQTAEPSPGKG
jgi:hypothetical protein